MNNEVFKRDQALGRLENSQSSGLIAAGKEIAAEIAQRLGRVTSTEVLAELRRRGYDPDTRDKRFMGPVFRKGWKRIGYESSGSHKRPVSVWCLDFADEQNDS